MECPNTIEGLLTEAIMARVLEKLGPMPAHRYNQMWSAVLETLNGHLPRIRAGQCPMSRGEFLRMMGD